MEKDKKKRLKKRIYRIVIITIAFAMIAGSFAWVSVSQGINKTVIIVIASALAAIYLGTIIAVELAYNKREKENKK